MARKRNESGAAVALDEEDRRILRLLQVDSTRPLEQISARVGLSKTAVWNRIQRMLQDGVIVRQAAIVDPGKVGLSETFFVAIRTSQHNAAWLKNLQKVLADMPEVTEAHRLAGEIDYLLKVQVGSTREFDDFYKALVARIDLFEVTSHLSMEVLKRDTQIPV